jgi:transcriptional regulator NrdR family protein
LEVNRHIEIRPGDLRCPRCFALDIVPSLPRGLVDAIMRRFHRLPRHCRACGRRFYATEEEIQKAQESPAQ